MSGGADHEARPDLDACAREPIHLPGSIQPHGRMVVLADDGTVVAVSANAGDLLDDAPAAVLGRPFAAAAPVLAGLVGARIAAGLTGEPVVVGGLDLDGAAPARAGDGSADGRRRSATLHRHDGLVFVEVEEEAAPLAGDPGAVDGVAALSTLVRRLDPSAEDRDVFLAVAEAVRGITGFDRVLVYRFDEAYVGTVVGEARNDRLPSYLDLRFPASDIPAQARQLYLANSIRQIPDVEYRPVPLIAAAGRPPIDLGQASLRSVSPVHLEYMRNMGTAASMSVSILVEGRLWGLIACHHKTPHRVAAAARRIADLIARMFALRIAAHARQRDAADRLQRQGAVTALLTAMAEAPSFADGLRRHGDLLLAATRATGAVLIEAGTVSRIGEAPTEDDARRIARWLDDHATDEVTVTDELSALLPALAGAADRASGMIAIALSRVHASWLIWVRPDEVRTVTWGGDPTKQFETIGPDTRISPRKSFDAWRETVRRRARPWTAAEVEAARALRSAIVDIVLRKAEEVAAVSEDLRRTNKELEAFSYSISHDLRAPFRHIVGYAELLSERSGAALDDKAQRYLKTIIEAAQGAGTLVDDLLHFSQLGRMAIQKVNVDMNKLASEVVRSLQFEARDRTIDWLVAPLPPTFGDPSLLRQVLFNLVANAVKYTRTTHAPAIEVGGWEGESETTYYVRDNGIGFDMAYADKLFQVFQRLNRSEDFEGTGIGLALVRRVVERHGGRSWASGQVGRGATFYVALPVHRETPKPDG